MQAKLMDQQKDFREYTENFIQRQPRYAVKQIGKKSWRTKNKPLSDKPIKAHLEGQYYVGVLGKWYPDYAILDIDDRERDTAEEIRESLKLDSSNSMIMESESPDSYHILFRPSYKGKPPSIRALNEILKPHAIEKGIEVYPQANKVIRLPFGHKQYPIDLEYIHLDTWDKMLRWFNKLDDMDLREIPNQQLILDLNIRPDKAHKTSCYAEGKYLYFNGLLEKSTRYDSQWKVIYYLYRQHNIALESAIEITWQWIRTKHNNKSKDIKTSPQTVKKEIIRQARHIYTNYELSYFYPDDTHNLYNGYITKGDIEEIFYFAKGNIPKAKFLFNLVKYCYPRQYRTFIQLHSNTLLQWSNVKGYQKQLEDLQRLRIVKRIDSYQVDSFAKSIKIKWNFRDPGKAILIDSRAPEDLPETIRASYKPEEFRELLLKSGAKRTSAYMTVKAIYEVSKKV
jgi:hypothetical protein